ncbi:retrovirus-related pol polyprotein from transposon TNT 1-94 [Tanacetum coccineum]
MEEAKTTESMDNKFKELLEEKPIFHVLENYTYYRKMLDEVSMDKRRNYIVPLKVNGTTPINALADTRASNSVMHYKLYKVLGLGKACPSNDKLLMADKTIAKAYGIVRNMRLQIGFQACVYAFEVGRDEKRNLKYGPTLPPFFDIEYEMEGASAMEAYFNPFKNIIVYKKLVEFLGSLPIQLKNIEWTSEGYNTYRKTKGDEDWHAKFEIMSLSGCKFTRGFKTKETKRKLSGKFNLDDILW